MTDFYAFAQESDDDGGVVDERRLASNCDKYDVSFSQGICWLKGFAESSTIKYWFINVTDDGKLLFFFVFHEK